MNRISTRNGCARWARLVAAVALFGWAGAAQAQVTYVGAGTLTDGTGNLQVALPGGWAANDTCFLYAASVDNQTHSITGATGWAAVVTQANSGTTEHVSMWWKRLGASESTPTLTRGNSSAQLIARIVCYGGVDATSPYVTSPLNATSNAAGNPMAVATAAVNTTGLGADAIVLHFIGTTATQNFGYSSPTGVPTGMTYSPGDVTGGVNGARTGIAIYSGLQATEGSTGTANVTVSRLAQDGAVQLALKPAAPSATITIGNGSAEPGNSTINAGQVGPIDAFSVQTNIGTATITAVTVNLTAGATALTNLFINSTAACTGTTYGTLASPVAGNNTVTLGTTISANTTSGSTNLYVCGTAATVGVSTPVTGNVSSVTAAGYTSTDSDTTNATLTVDPPPSNTVTIGNGSAEPGNSTITLGQVGPIDAFSVQTNAGTATITAVTVNLTAGATALANLFINSAATCTGTTYGTLASPVAGNNTVTLTTNISANTTSGSTNRYVCGTAGTVVVSTPVTGNVSSVTAAGYASTDNDTTNATLTVAPTPTVTIGNGSAEPGDSTINAGQVGPIDAFSVQTNTGTATLTAVTVNLTAGAAALTNLFINSTAACTGTTYGTLASPVVGNNTVTLGTTLSANTTSGSTNVYVCGTAKAVASSTPVTGNVSSVTAAGYASTDNDTTNATLTVAPPPAITIGNGSAEPGNSTIYVGQVGPIDAFSVQTNTGTATITAVTVRLTWGAAALTNLFINSTAACTGTTYGTLASPVLGDNTITLGTTLSANTSSGTIDRYVCGTAASVASEVSVVGTVASVTAAGYTSTDNDTTNAVLTVAPLILGTTTGTVTAAASSCSQMSAYASYTGDVDGNATVSFSRSTDGVAFGGLAACTNLGGASSPRVCVDATVAPSTAYWYRAQYSDPGGVTGTNPVTMASSVSTPACPASLVLSNPGGQPGAGTLTVGAATWTLVGQLALRASAGTLYLDSIGIVNGATTPKASGGDLQLNLTNAAGTAVYSTGSWDGTKWVFGSIADPSTGAPISVGTTATTFRVYATAHYGAAAAEKFAMNVDPANITAVAPSSPTTGTAFTASTFTIAAPGTIDEGHPSNTTAALVSIVNPSRGKVVGSTFLVQIYVYSSNGSAIAAMGLTTTGTAPTCVSNDPAITPTSHTFASPSAAMYSKVVGPLAAGTYTLKACARNGTGVSIVSAPVTVTVRAAGTGDGTLLVRDNSSQLCSDCHDQSKIKPHSSESTGTSNGIWSTSCRDCHTPHNTRNLFLVSEQIVPPSASGTYQPARDVRIATKVGDSQIAGVSTPAQSSYVNSDNSGPCQVCHTRTASGGGIPRWRNTGNSDTHYVGAATQPCTACHSHKEGFAAGESGGGSDCDSCHADIFGPMNTTSGSYHHYMNNGWSGSSAGSGTTTYPTAAWGTTADTNRRCVACHVDHNIFRPDVNPSGGRAKNLRTAFNLTPTTTTNFTNTDFDNALAGGGLCLSCHTSAQTKSYTQPDGTTSTPVIDKAGYNASIHNYNAAASFRDSSTFNGNCVKCHTDTNAKARQTSTPPNQFGLHDSALRRISNPINDAIVTGTATGTQNANSVVDTGQAWTAGQYDGWNVTISDANGTRSSVVVQTSATTLSVETPWATAPINGTTTYTLGEPAEERLCKQCHSGGVAGNDPFNAQAMSQRAKRFDQYLRVYGTGTITLTSGSTTLTGSGTTWYYSNGNATFTNGSATVTLSAPLANLASLVGWSIKSTATAQPRWHTIVAVQSTTQLTISPPFADPSVTGTYVIGIGDWYIKCDADTTGVWYRILDITSATAGVLYPAYGGAACSARTYVARSSPGHPFAITAGLHKPTESTASGWNAGAARHVTCADCHDPHKAAAGNHTPGAATTANLGAVSTGTWGVTPAFSSRNATGGTFTNNSTTVTTSGSTFLAADVGKNIVAPDGSVLAIKTYNSGTSVTTTRYSGPTQSNASFRIGDPVAAATFTVVTNMTTANAQYQLCLKCHSNYGYGATPPNTSFFTVGGSPTGAAVPQTNTANDFNPFKFATHAIFERGRNQPPANANPNWASSAGRKQNAPNTGLDNTFVDGWGAQSILTCTDCHLSDSGEDPWGPHGSANPWLLRGIDPNVTVTIAGGTVVYPNNCYYPGESGLSSGVPNTGDRRNLCLNCHRADVYGMVSRTGNSSGSSCNGGTTLGSGIPYRNLARVNHPVDNRAHSNSVNAGALTRWGIYCMQCHGGVSIGAIHGTNEGLGAAGTSYRGKRFLNGASWSAHTRASTSTGVSCTTPGTATSAVNTCSDTRTATGNTANYDYESGAD